MNLTHLFRDFFHSERSGGFVLICCSICSLIASTIFPDYLHFWHLEVDGVSLTHLINDGLMTIFFLLIGLELEREIYQGELSTLRNALFPAVAALGGMVVPAVVYILFNFENGSLRGFGIPMATDIAFALAVLTLLSNRVPAALKVFLTALAVMDDLGAITVIALFYTKDLNFLYIGVGPGVFAFMFLLNRLKVCVLWPYLLGGPILWYCTLQSGIHATISGVLLAFVIPFGDGTEKSPSYMLQKFLHWPVAFAVLPLFALANTSIELDNELMANLVNPITLGIFAGLIVGKPLGIYTFCWIWLKAKLGDAPPQVTLAHILGVGFLGGIGFTMSVFISLLAFNDLETLNQAKIVVMATSVLSGVFGFLWLRRLPSTTVQ